MHGSADDFYNIISDTCVSVNVHFTQHPVRNNKNRISSIGIRVVTGDADTPCADIQIDLLNCRASINNRIIIGSNIIGNIRVKKFSNGWRVFIPNCEHPHAVMWITCEKDMLLFNVSRASKLSSTSHGLLGKSKIVRDVYCPTIITINLNSCVENTNTYLLYILFGNITTPLFCDFNHVYFAPIIVYCM